MVKYKELYENQLKFIKIKYYTGFKCPKCSAEIYMQGTEFVCSNEDCSYDVDALEIFNRYANGKYERIEEVN